MDGYDVNKLDEGIKEAVIILNKHGFKTFESCQGGKGHSFPEPTILFEGSEFDLIRAFETCQLYKLCVFEARRVFTKTSIYKNGNKYMGEVWDKPHNELTFILHSETGTIFRPH
jgi:hypothetical protein